jgi:hypothetical protein
VASRFISRLPFITVVTSLFVSLLKGGHHFGFRLDGLDHYLAATKYGLIGLQLQATVGFEFFNC